MPGGQGQTPSSPTPTPSHPQGSPPNLSTFLQTQPQSLSTSNPKHKSNHFSQPQTQPPNLFTCLEPQHQPETCPLLSSLTVSTKPSPASSRLKTSRPPSGLPDPTPHTAAKPGICVKTPKARTGSAHPPDLGSGSHRHSDSARHGPSPSCLGLGWSRCPGCILLIGVSACTERGLPQLPALPTHFPTKQCLLLICLPGLTTIYPLPSVSSVMPVYLSSCLQHPFPQGQARWVSNPW